MLRDAVAQADDPAGLWQTINDMHPLSRSARPEDGRRALIQFTESSTRSAAKRVSEYWIGAPSRSTLT